MKAKLMIVAITAYFITFLLCGCCTPPQVGSVGVRLIPQERDWWCWAACTEMISEYYLGTFKGVPQCESANFVHGTPPDCCTGCSGNCPCWGDGWGASIGDIQNNWSHWNFTYKYISDSLPWEDDDEDDVKDTISTTSFCKKSPIYVVWWWYPIGWNGGHVVTAYGYAEVGNDRYVYYYNPLPESCDRDATGNCTSAAGGEDAITTYDAFVDDGVHSWGDTFYDFENTGS
jgi:hypothetical protein